jgi:hypothetical protein
MDEAKSLALIRSFSVADSGWGVGGSGGGKAVGIVHAGDIVVGNSTRTTGGTRATNNPAHATNPKSCGSRIVRKTKRITQVIVLDDSDDDTHDNH